MRLSKTTVRTIKQETFEHMQKILLIFQELAPLDYKTIVGELGWDKEKVE